MKRNREAELRRLFDAARDLPPETRMRFLSEECRHDAELHERVESLLACDQEERCFLDSPLLTEEDKRLLVGNDEHAWEWRLPERLGRYRVVRVIGSGSASMVFEAELESPRRAVAVKVLRPGVSTTSMLRRFQFEASVLRRLDHPFIARLYDAGTTDTGHGPQPFFAMELVEGRRLTEFAGEHDLSTRGRLELLAQICDGVHHAHTKGIIHRDLKPGNILVDPQGRPRILDFGVARNIESDFRARTAHTATGQLIGTLEYMSPEQATGTSDEIDTRSDIYALGVIGFELLSGRPPYALENLALPDAVHIICEVQPPRLSAFSTVFRGDVETIMAKAMEKRKERRYQSASDLAADIRRHVRHEPIVARPPSVLYQLGKYARRHRAWFTGSVAALVCLAGGIAGTGYGLVRAVQQRRLAELRRHEAELARLDAERQRSIAEQRFHDAEQARTEAETVTELMERMLRSVDPEELGRDVLVLDILNGASTVIDQELADQPLVEARLRESLGGTYEALGDFPSSIAQLESVVATKRREFGESDEETLRSMTNLATVYGKYGQYESAAAQLESVLAAQRAIVGEEHPDTLNTMNSLAMAYLEQGHCDLAEPLFNKILSHRQRLLGDDHPGTLSSMGNLASLYADRGQYDRAETLRLRVLEACRRIHGNEHPATLGAIRGLAYVYYMQGRYAQAERRYLDTLADHRRVLGDRHPVVAGLYNNLAELYRTTRRFAEAEAQYAQAIRICRETLGPENPTTLITMYNQALMYHEQNHIDEAKAIYVGLVDRLSRILGDEHPKTQECLNNLAAIFVAEGAYEKAEPLYLSAADTLSRVRGATHPKVLACRSNLGELYRKAGRIEEAELILSEIVDIARRTMPARHWYLGVFLVKYGRCLIELNRLEEAEEALIEGRSILRDTFGPDHQRSADAGAALAELARTAGRSELASATRR